MDCSPPGSSVHEIFQVRILEWVAISSSRASSQPRDQTCVSYIGRQILYHWAAWEALSWLVVQSLSCVQLFAIPWIPPHQASLLHYFPEFAQTHVHWVDDAIQPSHPLSPPSSPALNLSQHLVSHNLNYLMEISLVVQWLRIQLPMQGTWVPSLVREDPTCCEATKPMHHNYWALAPWSLCSATEKPPQRETSELQGRLALAHHN